LWPGESSGVTVNQIKSLGQVGIWPERRPGRDIPFLILTALAACAQHGYGIMTGVSNISSGRVKLLASPRPARAVQIMNWKHYAVALAIPLGLAATLNWAGLDHPSVTRTIMITACAATLGGMALASRWANAWQPS
jgi:hypothetical protein